MYRCGICEAVSKPKEPRKVHAILREDGTINYEVAVCPNCKCDLDHGIPFSTLRNAYLREPAREVALAPVVEPTSPVLLTPKRVKLGGVIVSNR